MAKQQCVICGKSLGILSEKTLTTDKLLLCKTCSQKANRSFPVYKHSLDEYHTHLTQMDGSRRIYEALFAPLINEKQVEEGSPYNNKHNNPRVKRYGGGNESIWAADEYGLMLFMSSQMVNRGEDGDRNLVYRYAELAAYRYSSEDDINEIHLTFNCPLLVKEISVTVYDRNVYNAFDKHFLGIDRKSTRLNSSH